jgi:hypothetical protein
MNSTVKLAMAKVAQSKSKGKGFVSELNKALSPKSLASTKATTQPLKSGKRK